jgi:hypothetical protein
LNRDYPHHRHQPHDMSGLFFYDSVRWLLYSGIRIGTGVDKGAVYGWKNLNRLSSSQSSTSSSYPFIYSEVTGYAITFFSWVYSELKTDESLHAAKESANWIIKNMRLSSSSLLSAGRPEEDTFRDKGNLSNQIYAFDNGMIIIGLLNLYQLTKDSTLLYEAETMTKSLIRYFFEPSSNAITAALLDTDFKTISYGEGKWSTVPGPYHSKLALALLQLYYMTDNKLYIKVTESLCNFAKTFQKSDGRFMTNPDSEGLTFLHPHLYACEGLIYAGVTLCNNDYLISGLKGLAWALQQIKPNGGLPRSTYEKDIEQSDCMAQLLRLLLMCSNSDPLQKLLNEDDNGGIIETSIELLKKRLLDFSICEEENRGRAMKYQLSLDSECSWCTMFSSQALRLWSKERNEVKVEKECKTKKEQANIEWIDFYI